MAWTESRAVVVFLLIAPGVLAAGCVAPEPLAPGCDAASLIADGTRFLSSMAHAEGGVVAQRGAPPDPRLTAWVLIAAALARRSGPEDLFAPRPHTDWLAERVQPMLQEGTGVDSIANNLSLARAALQVWGRFAPDPRLVAVADPVHPQVTTLSEAWEVRYDAASGRYGGRLNEHLFAGFAARLFESDPTRLAAMGGALGNISHWMAGSAHDPFEGDVWFAAYARALLGPTPDAALAARLDARLSEARAGSGGAYSVPAASAPDASSTAAVLLGWGASGADLHDARVRSAVGFLCGIVRADGGIPFRGDLHVLVVKTTAEAVIALSLLAQPIPWPQGPQ